MILFWLRTSMLMYFLFISRPNPGPVESRGAGKPRPHLQVSPLRCYCLHQGTDEYILR